MRLTAYTDYALRTLMYLASHRDRLVTISEIAAEGAKYALPVVNKETISLPRSTVPLTKAWIFC